jgi:PBSX family phage terminase large subunit
MARRTKVSIAEEEIIEERGLAVADKDVELTVVGTRVFFENQTAKETILVNRGGAGSSKSYSIAQLLLYKFFNENQKKILILRKTLPSVRISTLPLLNELLNEYSLKDRIVEEKVHLNWYYNGALIHFQGIDDVEKIKCFHPDTDVLTKQGWKNIKDVKVGELIATMNPKNRRVIYKPVTKTFVYDYKGDMYSPASETNDRDSWSGFCVTPNHKMLITTAGKKRRGADELYFCEAKDLPVSAIAPQSAIWDRGDTGEYFSIPRVDCSGAKSSGKKNQKVYSTSGKWRALHNGRKKTDFPLDTWLKFFGWYISEGCCNGDLTVTISQTKEEGRKKLRAVLEEFDYGFGESAKSFSVYGKDLVSYLCQFGLSHEKFIPREIIDLHPSHLQHLFNSLIDGDGRRENKNRCNYCTNSPQLVDDVSEIGLKLGWVPLVREIDTKKYNPELKNPKPAWVISFVKRDYIGIGGNIQRKSYDGKVFCLEVQPYHTMLTRYNGRVIWTGNSSDWNYIWIEEATEFTWEEYQTIKLRLRAQSRDGLPNQIYLSFNPVDERHWIKEKLVEDATQNVKEIVSTYKDNPFLILYAPDYVQDLENLQKQDMSFYNIYTLGQWGKLENLIYNNWSTCAWLPDYNAVDHVYYGLDFGYNEPTALIECRLKNKEIWERELLYHTKLTNSDLINQLHRVIPEEAKKKYYIYADAAEPDRIKEIKDAGFKIKPAIKLITNGIDIVKRHSVHVHEESINLIKEKKAYSWKKDKNGNVLDEPVDIWNHLMDAERYAVHTGTKREGVRIRFI